jgi:hypothetical protein
MAVHETRNTTEVSAWCNTCNRRTMHRVDDRRRGPCMEHTATGCGDEGLSKKQAKVRAKMEREEREPRLF